MSWLRLDDGFTGNPKIVQLTDAQFRVWMKVLCYCAKAQDPTVDALTQREIRGLTRHRIDTFSRIGLLCGSHTGSDSTYEVNDWSKYQPKDATSAERQARWRARKAAEATVTSPVTQPVTDTVSETSTSRAGTRAVPSSPVLETEAAGSTPNGSAAASNELRTALTLAGWQDWQLARAEQDPRRAAVALERAETEARSNPGGYAWRLFTGSGPIEKVEARRAIENGSGHGPSYVAGLIRNGVITEPHELETELDLAGVDDEEREALVAQFALARALEARR